MAASINKDTLVKHSFWILAGCYFVLVLACLAVLVTGVSATVGKEQEELKTAQDQIKSITSSEPRNPQWVEAYEKQDKFISDKKDEVWKKAWDTQKAMITWPRKLQGTFANKYPYFGDPIDTFDCMAFHDEYSSQLWDAVKVVDPLINQTGEGAVQCKDGDWVGVLRLEKNFQKPPSKDDIWLAQEELWIKRELLRVIRDANDTVARFKEKTSETPAEKDKQEAKAGAAAEKDKQEAKASAAVEKEPKATKPEAAAPDKDQKVSKPAPAAPPTDPNHKIFRNPYWELDLTLAPGDKGKHVLRGKITNISKRKQSLDVKFKVFLQDSKDDPSFAPLLVDGLPLAAGQSKEIKEVTVPEQLARDGLHGVEQILNWKTAPVKRLDRLELSYPSSRVVRSLKPPRFLVPAAAAEGSEADASSGDKSAGAAALSSGTALPGGPAGGEYRYPGGGAGTQQTRSGLDIDRYIDVSEQVRHLPVAMLVIVDEDHLSELLAAFANSNLRIQTTQYHWQHCKDKMKPLANGSETIPDTTPRDRSGFGQLGYRGPPGGSTRERSYGAPGWIGPSGGARGAGAYPGATYMPGGPGAAPPSPGGRSSVAGPGVGTTGGTIFRGPGTERMPGSTFVTGEEEEEEDLNLLEVAVYGLASLYERYPARPPEKPAEQSADKSADKPASSATGN